jgi:hypothetical protein
VPQAHNPSAECIPTVEVGLLEFKNSSKNGSHHVLLGYLSSKCAKTHLWPFVNSQLFSGVIPRIPVRKGGVGKGKGGTGAREGREGRGWKGREGKRREVDPHSIVLDTPLHNFHHFLGLTGRKGREGSCLCL